MMFSVTVREQVMIAHSFKGALFGPAQKLHGATYVIDVTVRAGTLDENGVVMDIGAAHQVLKHALAPWAYQNLDELEEFKGINTTTEYLAKCLHDKLADVARSGGFGRNGDELASIAIVLNESHIASAGYDAPL